VNRLVSAEWLKLRTVRAFWGYLAAVVVFAAIGAAGSVGSATAEDRAQESFVADLAGIASLTSLIALVLGIVVITGEFRHGTITPTFLATPQRERVLSAKLVFVVLGAVSLALLALAVIAAIAVPWLLILGDSVVLDGETAKAAGRALLGSVLWAALGLAVGASVHGQVAALIGTLIWILLVESLLSVLLGVLDLDEVTGFLPNAAISVVLGDESEELLTFWPSVLVALGWIAAVGAFGVVRTRRRDIT
jgi:ABC-type transport system involved in multi-copper enzyme maturation permease subunit